MGTLGKDFPLLQKATTKEVPSTIFVASLLLVFGRQFYVTRMLGALAAILLPGEAVTVDKCQPSEDSGAKAWKELNDIVWLNHIASPSSRIPVTRDKQKPSWVKLL